MQHNFGSEPAPSQVWTTAYAPADRRPVLKAILRGACLKCPKCGRKGLFSSYLAVSRTCTGCGEELFHHRADDAPPYFTIFIVGHIIVSLVMTAELLYGPPLWLHFAIWLPLTVLLSLTLLPIVKGAIVGLQWALKMHGFEDAASPGDALNPSGLQ